jgi:hypothetical protein
LPDFLNNPPPPNLQPPIQSSAYFAAELRDAVGRIRDDTWSLHWQGLDGAHVISILDAAARSFQSMEDEALRALAQFPRVQRWDDQRAPERFFREWMSSQLEKMYGRRVRSRRCRADERCVQPR